MHRTANAIEVAAGALSGGLLKDMLQKDERILVPIKNEILVPAPAHEELLNC